MWFRWHSDKGWGCSTHIPAKLLNFWSSCLPWFFYGYLFLEARSFACLALFGVRLHVNNMLAKMYLFSFVPTVFSGIFEIVCFIYRQRHGCLGANRSEQMGFIWAVVWGFLREINLTTWLSVRTNFSFRKSIACLGDQITRELSRFYGSRPLISKYTSIGVYQRKFRNLTSDYTESCQEMWSRRCDIAEMWDMRIWRVGSARNAVFFHSFVASPARKVRS